MDVWDSMVNVACFLLNIKWGFCVMSQKLGLQAHTTQVVISALAKMQEFLLNYPSKILSHMAAISEMNSSILLLTRNPSHSGSWNLQAQTVLREKLPSPNLQESMVSIEIRSHCVTKFIEMPWLPQSNKCN